jgi:hypothetical protein
MNDDQSKPADKAGDQPDYNQPVAYDAQGRPLYAHPPAQPLPMQRQSAPGHIQQQGQPYGPQTGAGPSVTHQYVHVTRPLEPHDIEIPPHIKERHERSRTQYPQLNLSEGEYIISAVRRHPIGLFQIWGFALLLIATLVGVLAGGILGGGANEEVAILGAVGIGLIAVLIFIGAGIAMYVYNNNRFFLTNESVIQEIQNSLFNKHEQTVSLANIEDASYRQDGIVAHMLNYGTIRLSTEGDETTYRFSYVANPKRHIAVLNNAVEAFKNGRAVEPPADGDQS